MTKHRKRATFRAGYNDTLSLLDQELAHLGARNITIEIALTEAEIRLDGRPRSGAKPSYPGVVISFDGKQGRYSFPCDTYDAFEDNVRAIALSLEALRAVNRYGVTKIGEQYAGFAALPPPMVTELFMTEAGAIAVLNQFAPGGKVSRNNLRETYHSAVMRLHPDRGGDARSFRQVRRAKEVLDTAWGLS